MTWSSHCVGIEKAGGQHVGKGSGCAIHVEMAQYRPPASARAILRCDDSSLSALRCGLIYAHLRFGAFTLC